MLKKKLILGKLQFSKYKVAKSAGAVEYIDNISANW